VKPDPTSPNNPPSGLNRMPSKEEFDSGVRQVTSERRKVLSSNALASHTLQEAMLECELSDAGATRC